jgi:translation initiation factor 2 subunit 2
MEFPKALRRDPEKLLLYLNKELASAGYIAGDRVIFLGRKEPSSFGTLIDRYVKEYVICPVCGSLQLREITLKSMHRFVQYELANPKEAHIYV